MEKPYVNYDKMLDIKARVLLYRADMENHTGYTVQIICYKERVGVSIDRRGHFIFKSWDVLINPIAVDYISEKLFVPESDSIELIKFFRHVYEKDIVCS
jgi:hypothetical protein